MSVLTERDLKLSPDLINHQTADTLYQQVYDILLDRILSGIAPSGARLPAEQDLTTMLGVSRITVKRALNELASSGMVRRQRGRGTMVIYDPAAPIVKGSFENLLDGLTRMGVKTKVELLSVETISPGPRITENLQLPEGAKVQRIVRRRRLDGEPFSYLITHVPMTIAVHFTRESLSTSSLIAMLENAGHAPQSAEQTISAAAAEPEVADALDLAAGAPVLKLHRIMHDVLGRPIQDVQATYRPDRFQYHMRLTRQSETDWTSGPSPSAE